MEGVRRSLTGQLYVLGLTLIHALPPPSAKRADARLTGEPERPN
jgi:hypothetical protein